MTDQGSDVIGLFLSAFVAERGDGRPTGSGLVVT